MLPSPWRASFLEVMASRGGKCVRPQGHIMGRARRPRQAQKWRISCYILHNVSEIWWDDSALLGEFEQLVLLALLRLGRGASGARGRRRHTAPGRRPAP